MNKIIIGTSCYDNIKEGNLVSITGDGGNAWGYYGNAYKKLAPSFRLWQYYDQNFDCLSDKELIDYYINEFYNHRLANLNVNELLEIMKTKFGSEIILLCHETPGIILSKEHFCHRRLIADLIELETGIIIPEFSQVNNELIIQETYDLKPRIKTLIKK